MKMMHDCRATHILRVIWDEEYDGDIHFYVWLKERSIWGQTSQIMSNFPNQNFLLETCLSCPVSSQDSKNVIYFNVKELGMQKIAFQIVTSWPLPGFLTIAQPKIKILPWNLICLLFVCSFTTCSSVFRLTPKFLIL